MVEEISEYDKYNNPDLSTTGPIKPKKEVALKLNKYEALRQSGVETSVIGRNQSEVNRADDGPGEIVGGQNINESRAFNQSATENMFSSLAKGTGLFASTVGSLVTTLPEGIIRATAGAFDKDMSGAEAFSKLYDNESSKMWDKFNKGAEAMFPVYKPEAYDKADLFSATTLGSSQFWGETILKNAGFTAGAIIGGGQVAKGLQLAGKLFMGARAAESAVAFNALVAAGETPIAAATKLSSMIPYAVDKATQVATGAIVSFGEASMEAKQVKDELNQQFVDNYKAKNNGSVPDAETLTKFSDYASSAGNTTLAVNMAALTGLETLQFGKLWSRGFKEEVERVGKIAVKDGVTEAIAPSLGKKIAKGVSAYATNTLSEASEEGIQTGTQAAAKDYYSRKYDKNGITDVQDGVLSVLSGMQETFGSRNGWESMLAGAITGAGSHAATSLVSRIVSGSTPSDFDNAQILSNRLNQAKEKFAPHLNSLIRAASINREQEENAALPTPSRKKHEDLNAESFRTFVQPFIETGRFDLLENVLNQEYAKDEDRFKLDNGENATRKSGKEFVSKLVKDAKKLKTSWEAMQDFMPKAHPEVREALWSTAADIENRNERFNSLNTKLLVQTGVNFDSSQTREEYLDKVQKVIDNNPTVDGEILDIGQANDIVNLYEDKQQLLAKYQGLKTTEIQAAIVAENAAQQEEKAAGVPEAVTPAAEVTPTPTVKQPETPVVATQDAEVEDSRPDAVEAQPEAEIEAVPESKPAEPVLTAYEKNYKAHYDNYKQYHAAALDTLSKIEGKNKEDSKAEALQALKDRLPEADTKSDKAALEDLIKELETAETTTKTDTNKDTNKVDSAKQLVITELSKLPSYETTLRELGNSVINNTDEELYAERLRKQGWGNNELDKKIPSYNALAAIVALHDLMFDSASQTKKEEPTIDPIVKELDQEPVSQVLVDDEKVQTDYNEMSKKSATLNRTGANHLDAITNKISSVLRYQNFINNPDGSFSDLQLMVVTNTDPTNTKSLYYKLQNKTQKIHEAKLAVNKEAPTNGIMLVVVKKDTKELVLADAGGNISGYSTQENVSDDIDAKEYGVLVTTIVAQQNRASGEHAVSYKHFGRVNNEGENVTEKEALNPNTSVGDKWAKHVKEMENNRAAMLSGDIKFLDIEYGSQGIFQNKGKDVVANGLGDVFGKEVNDPAFSFIVPTTSSVSKEDYSTIGAAEGLKAGEEREVRVGKPYVIYNGKLYPLQARKLNAEEIAKATDLFKQAQDAYKTDKEASKKFARQAKEIVYVSKEELTNILRGKVSLDILNGRYRQIDANKLNDRSVAGNTYRESILTGEKPILSINYKPHPTTTEMAPNYLNGYLVYKPLPNVIETSILETTLDEKDFNALASAKNVITGHNLVTLAVKDSTGISMGTVVFIKNKLYTQTQINNDDVINTPLSKVELGRFNKLLKINKDLIKKINPVFDRLLGLQDEGKYFPEMGLANVPKDTLINKYKLTEEEAILLIKNGWSFYSSLSTALTEYSYFLLGEQENNKVLSDKAIKEIKKLGFYKLLQSFDSSLDNLIITTQNTVADVVAEPVTSFANDLDNMFASFGLGETTTQDDDAFDLGRIASLAQSNTKENIKELKEWWKNAFGDESLEIVDSLIKGNRFGEYSAAITKVFSGAEVGTGYHEAFHKVTQEYLTPKQLKSLYNEVRKLPGKSEFTDKEAEEYRAEDFRLYQLSGQKVINGQPVRNSLFRKIYNYLRTLLTGKITAEQVYNKLASKKGYTGAKKFNVQQFTKLGRGAIPGLTHRQTMNVVDTVNGYFFKRLFSANYTPDQLFGSVGNKLIKGLYGRVFENVKADFAKLIEAAKAGKIPQEIFMPIAQHYKLMLDMSLNDGKGGLSKAAIKAHEYHLKGLGIVLSEEATNSEDLPLDELDKATQDAADNENKTRDTPYDKNANEESSIHSAPNSIKLLLMSLPAVDVNGNPAFNEIGGPKLNDYMQSMKLLYSNMSGMTKYEDMWNKLEEMSDRFPVFKELMKRLGAPGTNKSLEQQLLENDFRQAFAKFESQGTITLINRETGEVYQVDANANKLKDKIKENWIGNLRGLAQNPTSFVKAGNDGILTIEPTEDFWKLNKKDFLEAIGINFTGLSAEQVNSMIKTETYNPIQQYIKKLTEEGRPVNDLWANAKDKTGKDISVRGRLDELLAIEMPLSTETIELSYISAEGKRIYAVSLHNYHSLVVSHINNATSKQQLFADYPHLNNPYTQNSVWLSTVFDKNGVKIPGQKLVMNTVSGLKFDDDVDSGVAATKMEPSDKIVQEINDLLGKGTVSLIRAADKGSEYAFGGLTYANGTKLAVSLQSVQDAEGLNTKEVKSIFLGYFKDELATIRTFRKGVGKNVAIYKDNADKFSLFADILSPKTLSEVEAYKDNTEELSAALEVKIGDEIVKYLEQYADDIKQYAEDRKVGLATKKGYTGIDARYTGNTQKGLTRAIQTFAVNHMINMQEQAKLLVGDSRFYKDKIKRISAGTGTKKFAASSKTINNWFNDFYKNGVNRLDGKKSDGLINTVIYGDVKANLNEFEDYVQVVEAKLKQQGVSPKEARAQAEKIMASYNNMEEGDAQGWITLDEYREFFIRVGGAYWTDMHEKQYQYETALERGEEQGENPNFLFMPIKAQHFGPQVMEGLYAPAFHKYSLAPLYPSLVKGRNMETLLNSMKDNKIGYALFGSGSKVGSLVDAKGKLPAFYDGEGNMSGIMTATNYNTSLNYKISRLELVNWITKDEEISPDRICDATSEEAIIQLKNAGYKVASHNLEFSAKSPIGDFDITHKVALAQLAGKYYIYDMPQTEFLDDAVGKNTKTAGHIKVTNNFNPRFIELTEENLTKEYASPANTYSKIIKSLENKEGTSYWINNSNKSLGTSKTGKLVKQMDEGKYTANMNNWFDENYPETAATPIQQIHYENLGIQLDIAPKVKDSIIFGSQFRKLLFSNIFGENINPALKTLSDEYNSLIDMGVKQEFKKLIKKLGIEYNSKTDIYTFNGDYTKLVQQLKDNLEDKDTADNILDTLQVDENGQLKYPIDAAVNRDKIESMLFSIVNSKVIKQKMHGNALTHHASTGMEPKGKRTVGTSNYLKFYTQEGPNGTTTAMEVEIPMNKSFQPLLDKFGGDLDTLNKAISEGKVDSKVLTMVGYRIPTQGLNSMDVMTIKRFMPSTSGIAIILPTGIVAKGGGDYDIDKLNIFMHNLHKDEEGKGQVYDKTSKEGIQNRLLEIMSEVLTHPDNFIDLTTPNTTETLTDLVAEIRKAQGQDAVTGNSKTKEFRFDFIMDQFTYFLGGKAALGIAATHNTHHVLSQIAKVMLNAKIPFTHNVSEKTGYRSRVVKTPDGEHTIHETFDQVDMSGIYTKGGQKITDLISQFINAYVDVARDPFYKDLNAGTEVTAIWMYLIRAGVDIKTIGFFMTQPIIKEYVQAKKLNNSLVVSSNGKKKGTRKVDLTEKGKIKLKAKIDAEENKEEKKRLTLILENGSVYNDVLIKYGRLESVKDFPMDFTSKNINNILLTNIAVVARGEELDNSFRIDQSLLLQAFVEIEKQAGELTTLMQDTNNDTTKLQNYGSLYQREQVAEKVKESLVIPAGTSERIKATTIVGSFDISNSLAKMYGELSLYTKYPEIKATINTLLSTIDSKKDFSKEYAKVQNALVGFITQKFGKTLEGEPLFTKMSLFTDVKNENKVDTSNYTNYSGDALGSDKEWAKVAKETGIKTTNYLTTTLDKLSATNLQEVEDAYLQAVKDLGRGVLNAASESGKLVRRDYLQAKAADTVFAVGNIMNPGENSSKSDKSGNPYKVRSKTQSVDGGTGYAVQMSINLGKPVFVFNQRDNKWYTWNSASNVFELTSTPQLTPKFAGIGTRGLKESGKQAIKDVFEKSFGQLVAKPSLAKQLIAINKEGTLKDNALIKELVAQVNADVNGIDNIKMYSRRMTAFESNVISEAFRELLNSNDPTVQVFGRNLAYLTILQSGLDNSPITFTELVPFEFYGDLVKGAVDEASTMNKEQLMEQFLEAYNHKMSSGQGYRLQDFGLNVVADNSEKRGVNTSNILIESPFSGVETIKNSGLSIKDSNNFIDLLSPTIREQAYIQNKAKTANNMFSFGFRWAATNSDGVVKFNSEQSKSFGTIPNQVKINAHSKDGRYGYFSTDQNNNPLPELSQLQPIMDFIESKLGIDLGNYDSMLANIYDENSFIHQHRDTTESQSAAGYPVVVINLGADGKLIYDEDLSSNYNTFEEKIKAGQYGKTIKSVNLSNGSIYAFGVNGENRFAFHHRIFSGLNTKNPLKPIVLPNGEKLSNYRITLTFRRAQDLTEGIPTMPTRNLTTLSLQVDAAQQAEDKKLKQQSDSNVDTNENNEVDSTPPWNTDDNAVGTSTEIVSTKSSEQKEIDLQETINKEYAARVEKDKAKTKYELFPGVFANSGQKEAIDKIEDFLQSKDTEFLLKGRGGTGKTTIIKKALETFKGKVVGATIADSARRVLGEAFPGLKTYTVASLLGLVTEFDENTQEETFREKTDQEKMDAEEKGQDYDKMGEANRGAIIIDEGSMIGKDMYDLLVKRAKEIGAKIIFMGDNVQIPPIPKRGDPLEDSPIFKLLETGNSAELTQRMRQSGESPILPLTDLYANNVEKIERGETPVYNPLFIRATRLENNEGVGFTKSEKAFLDNFIVDLKNGMKTTIIGATHKALDSWNTKIRKELFNTDEPYVVGDSIVFNASMMQPKGRGAIVVINNGTRAEVLSVRKTSEGSLTLYELKIKYEEVDEKTGKLTFVEKEITTTAVADAIKLKAVMNQKYKEALNGTGYDRWKLYWNFRYKVAKIGYAYAITSHKVQGQTFDSVFVDENDIMTFRGGVKQVNKMMYTAVSRPRTKLVIYNQNAEINRPKFEPSATVNKIDASNKADDSNKICNT